MVKAVAGTRQYFAVQSLTISKEKLCILSFDATVLPTKRNSSKQYKNHALFRLSYQTLATFGLIIGLNVV